jgi:hypothetical protein
VRCWAKTPADIYAGILSLWMKHCSVGEIFVFSSKKKALQVLPLH